jgi:hypothetical protein
MVEAPKLGHMAIRAGLLIGVKKKIVLKERSLGPIRYK